MKMKTGLSHTPNWEIVKEDMELTDEGLLGLQWLHAREMVQGYITRADILECPH